MPKCSLLAGALASPDMLDDIGDNDQFSLLQKGLPKTQDNVVFAKIRQSPNED
jgi:hypothetical protein